MATLGGRIQALLETREMTRKELCKKTGLTEAAISRYITGKREPKSITLSEIAKALDVTVDELVGTACEQKSDLDGAVCLVARSVDKITPAQKKQLIEALAGF